MGYDQAERAAEAQAGHESGGAGVRLQGKHRLRRWFETHRAVVRLESFVELIGRHCTMTNDYAARNWPKSRIWSLCKSTTFREVAAPILLALMLFGGSWKTSPIFGEPDSWYPTLAVVLSLAALAAPELLHRITSREGSLPIGLVILAMFALWLLVRSFSDGGLIPAGIVKSARFAFLPCPWHSQALC